MTDHINKCGSNIFYKQREQPTKYYHQGAALTVLVKQSTGCVKVKIVFLLLTFCKP